MFHRNQVSIQPTKITLDIDEDDICIMNFYTDNNYPKLVVYIHDIDDRKREWFTNMEPKDTYIVMESVDATDDTTE